MTSDTVLGFKNIWLLSVFDHFVGLALKGLSISETNMINLDFRENPVLTNTRLQLILSNYKLLISNYLLS